MVPFKIFFVVFFCSSRKWAFKPRSRISSHIEADDIQEEQSNNGYLFRQKDGYRFGGSAAHLHVRRNQIWAPPPPPGSLYLINLSAPASWTSARKKNAYKMTARCGEREWFYWLNAKSPNSNNIFYWFSHVWWACLRWDKTSLKPVSEYRFTTVTAGL